MASPAPGGIVHVVDAKDKLLFQALARWAVNEHNVQKKTDLKYVKVLDAREQIVEGSQYYIELEATDDGQIGKYEAVIWAKSWQNFLELVKFQKLIGDGANY